jgi:hypothetical protein
MAKTGKTKRDQGQVSGYGNLATTENLQRHITACPQDWIKPLRPLWGAKDKRVDAVEESASAA